MNFGFTEEQNLLRDQVERFMQDTCPMTRAEISKADGLTGTMATSRRTWLVGLMVPEAYGGLGLKWIDQVVVLEAAATGLCPLPFASHALASSAILACANDEQKSRWLPPMVSGEVALVACTMTPIGSTPAAITATATANENATS